MPSMNAKYLPLLLSLATVCACGGESFEDKVNRSIAQAVNTTIEEAGTTEAEREELRKVLNEVGRDIDSVNFDQIGDVEAVGFRELKALLPDRLAGLSRTKHEGESATVLGLEFSEANATYGDGDRSVTAQIMDTGGAGVLLLSMAGWSKLEIDRETAEGSERTFTLDGYPAHEKVILRKAVASTQLSVLVNDRFVVSLSGRSVDAAALTAGFQALRLGGLPQGKK